MKQDTTPQKAAQKSARSAATGFSAEEKAAARARIKELKASELDGEGQAQAAIAAMTEPDRSLAARVHALIKAGAPGLSPKTWYGMPAYATPDGKVVCFFQPALKFKARYATLGFNDAAQLDDGALWPVAYALKELTPEVEARIVALVKKAVS